MTDQNLVKGDGPYPNRLTVQDLPVKAALVFAKGELATIDATGHVIKLTTSRIGGLVQVRNAVTGGAGDGDVTVSCNRLGSRILVSLPINAKAGDVLLINGSDGTGNAVVGVATDDLLNLGIGRIFELYRNTAIVAAAADLGVVDLGGY